MNPTPDHLWGPPEPPRPARSRLGRRLALATGVGAVLAVGGVAVAQAASAPSPSGSATAAPSASPSASGSAVPKRERTPRLAGTVVSASGTTIVVTDLQGFQRTIHTGSATEYEDGLTATPAAGTRIIAAGTVASDKTSLDATRISKFPERVDGRGLPGRGHGPGKAGRPHRGGPSGTPSATPSPSPTK